MKKLIFSGIFLLLSAATYAVMQFSQKPQEKCITVVYDSTRNLKGALKVFEQFPDFQRVLVEMSGYSSGQLERCQVSFIVNTEFDNLVPKPLVEDFLNSKRNVVWMGYNIWSLGDQLNRKMGLRYMGSFSKVSFDRCIFFYRGRSTHCSEPGLSMHPETIPTNEMKIEIMAETRIRGRELTPYLVRSQNRFYLADVNFGNVFQDFLEVFIGQPSRGQSLVLKPQSPQSVTVFR